ncbi:heterocyst-inhibiting protein PatX [Planktothrix sp.]|uniref:heterocyst-inhibiting protein PatX n=1 Tax=Planktothrix sp. TaxID=3088171 RepID=UPI0038D4D6FD
MMQTYTSLFLSVCLSVGVSTSALAVTPSTHQLSDIINHQQLLSARTRLNGPYQPERGGGRREFMDTRHSQEVNPQL